MLNSAFMHSQVDIRELSVMVFKRRKDVIFLWHTREGTHDLIFSFYLNMLLQFFSKCFCEMSSVTGGVTSKRKARF